MPVADIPSRIMDKPVVPTAALLDVMLVALRTTREGCGYGLIECPPQDAETQALGLILALLPDIEAPRDGLIVGGVRFRSGVTEERIAAEAATRFLVLTPELRKEVRAMEFAVLAVLP